MKTIVQTTFTLLLIAAFTYAKATVITVDNNSGAAADYADLGAAIEAAEIGDTLLVAGSATSYGSHIIRKKLTLIGSGYTGLSTVVGSLEFRKLTADSGSSGSYISGFKIDLLAFRPEYLNTANQQADSLLDFTVERNIIDKVQFTGSTNFGDIYKYTYKRFSFRNNIMTRYVALNDGTNKSFESIVLSNNIFDGLYFAGVVNVSISGGEESIDSFESASGFIIRNNIWTTRGSRAFEQIRNAIVENNIFYAINLITASEYEGLDTLQYSLNFNNNITYLTPQDLTDNSWFAVGANNQNVDPLFVNFPVDGAPFSFDHDYRLQDGSPAIGAGVNGEDLGIYGGAYPWPGPLELRPKGPIVTELEPVGSPSIPAGGTLEVRFKSVINN